MTAVAPASLPDDALLRRYVDMPESYTDCYMAATHCVVPLARFVQAFYTAPLFRCERFILGVAAKRPSTDAQAADVAEGRINTFAAWDVEDRTETQLLMRDMAGKTRSWFMVRNVSDTTELYFGSAVIADPSSQKLGPMFAALLPAHRIYSRLLLKGALRRLSPDPSPTAAR